jgi:hypothetical protein
MQRTALLIIIITTSTITTIIIEMNAGRGYPQRGKPLASAKHNPKVLIRWG